MNNLSFLLLTDNGVFTVSGTINTGIDCVFYRNDNNDVTVIHKGKYSDAFLDTLMTELHELSWTERVIFPVIDMRHFNETFKTLQDLSVSE